MHIWCVGELLALCMLMTCPQINTTVYGTGQKYMLHHLFKEYGKRDGNVALHALFLIRLSEQTLSTVVYKEG